MHSGGLGVHAYDDTTGVLGGRSGPTTGAYAVADIRVDGHLTSVQLGVRGMEQPAPVVKGDMSVGTGTYEIGSASCRKECVSTGRSRVSTYHLTRNHQLPTRRLSVNKHLTHTKHR